MDMKISQDRIVASKERRTLIPYSDMHVWRLEQVGRFPKRIRLGANRVGWSLRELQEWITARKAERNDNSFDEEGGSAV
jgi:prophage regulatory protein